MILTTLITLATILFLLLPGSQAGLFSGFPLEPYEVVLTGIWFILLWTLPWQKLTWAKPLMLSILGVLCVAKLITASTLPYGVSVCVKPALTNPTALPCENSVRHRTGKRTFISTNINYNGPVWPLYFFNDTKRFNFLPESKIDRETLPFYLSLEGYSHSSQAEVLDIDTSHTDVIVAINGEPQVINAHTISTITVPPKSHIVLTYATSERQPDEALSVSSSTPL